MKTLIASTAFVALATGVTGATGAMADPNPLRSAYFGETHMHTAFSLDAYIGGARLMPADALAFAKGQPVTMPDGTVMQHKRPLDFAMVSDHSEYLGEMYSTMYDDAPGHDNPDLETLRGMTDIEERQKWFLKYVISSNRSSTPQHPSFFCRRKHGEMRLEVEYSGRRRGKRSGCIYRLYRL